MHIPENSVYATKVAQQTTKETMAYLSTTTSDTLLKKWMAYALLCISNATAMNPMAIIERRGVCSKMNILCKIHIPFQEKVGMVHK
jgi:hypothetical protein